MLIHQISAWMLKISAVLLAGQIGTLAAAGIKLSDCQGEKGQAPAAPAISEIDFSGGKAVQAKAVAAGRYQGLRITPAQKVDLSKVERIEFDFFQTAYHQNGSAQIYIRFASKKGKSFEFKFQAKKWNHIVIDIPENMNEEVNFMIFNTYSTLDKPNETVAVGNLKFIPRQIKIDSNVVIDNKYTDLKYYRGNTGGNAPMTPEVSLIDSPKGKAVQVKALANGKYQALNLKLPEVLNTADIGMVEFDFYQTAYHRDGTGQVMLTWDQREGMSLNFPFKAKGWTHVAIPIDLRTVRMLRHGVTPAHCKINEVIFTLYSVLDKVGETFAIANLRFLPRTTGNAAIPVVKYRYLSAKPNQGEISGNTLTDGIISESSQVRYNWYSEDPNIEFDLGALYLVSEIKLSSIATPGNNISAFTVESSNDGKKFRTVARFVNKDDSGVKKKFSITGSDLKLLGRYFRLKGTRNRTDFYIDISEVQFKGKLPSDEELRSVAAASYDLGPEMPQINSQNYCLFSNDQGSFAISKTNGVLCKLAVGKDLIAERIYGTYDLSNGKKTVLSNDYSAKVTGFEKSADGVTVKFTLPELSGITFKRFYGWLDGTFTTRLSFTSTRRDRQILQTAQAVVLPQDLRRKGRYETWGAGHAFEHKLADDLTLTMPADTGPVVSFESPAKDLTMLTFRYKYDDRYVQIGSGTVTVVGFGDKRTMFTDNGWVLGDGLFEVNPQKNSSSAESRIIIARGDLIRAFDKYLQLPETKKFRAGIRRPAWLKDLRMIGGGGAWQNMFGNSPVDNAAYYAGMLREGYIVSTYLNDVFAWGDWNAFLTRGFFRNQFGGEIDVEDLKTMHKNIRKKSPRAKITEYTWLWSATQNSEVAKLHPEWFITKNAAGARVSFYPGEVNFYRLYGQPGAPSFQHAFKSITDRINKLGLDFWYLDGGGSPSAVDWSRLIVEAPDAYDQLHRAVREDIQKYGERGVQFNHPENPLGDIGYLEGSATALFAERNWRDGASWMYKFKLWQRPDKLFVPAFIYWRGPEALWSLKKYVLGTGLFPSLGEGGHSSYIPLMSLYSQTRWARLVSADIKPNWRYDQNIKFELMPLTYGDSGYLMIRSHFDKVQSGTFSCRMLPLGVKAKDKPVYKYVFTAVPTNGTISEPEAEEAYRQTGWQSDFTTRVQYLGTAPWSAQLSEKLTLEPGDMKLVYVTQSPGLVYSVDDMRCQLPLSETMGVTVKGQVSADKIELKTSSTRRSAEVIALLPAGKTAAAVTVNGQAVKGVLMNVFNSRFVRFAIDKGDAAITVKLADVRPAAAGKYELSVAPGKPGSKLGLTIQAPAASAGYKAMLTVENAAGIPVWNNEVELKSPTVRYAVSLPAALTGGSFKAVLSDAAGKVLAAAPFNLASGASLLKPAVHRMSKVVGEVKEIAPVKSAAGTLISGTACQYSQGDGKVEFEPAAGALTLKMARRTGAIWNVMAGAMLNKNLKRYIKVRFEGNYVEMSHGWQGPGIRNVTPCYGDSPSCAVMTLDYAVPDGYTVRSFASLGMVFANRQSTIPSLWGTKKVPDHISAVSGFCFGSSSNVEEHWFDTQMLGAPKDWNGQAYLGLCFQNSAPNRRLKLTLLATADRLPADAKLSRVAVMKGATNPVKLKTLTVPRASEAIVIDGKFDEKSYADALEFTDFTRLNAPAVVAPPSKLKLLTDGKKIYAAAEFSDPRGINNNPDAGQAWQTDGLDFYLARGKEQKFIDQYVFGAGGRVFAARHLPSGGRKIHPAPEWKCRVEGNTLYVEAAIPIDYSNNDLPITGFNAGRNRTGSSTEHYSITPGNAFRNFTLYNLQFD